MAIGTELDYINKNADLIVRVLEVGGGDSILIQTNWNDKSKRKNFLVDTGGGSGSHGKRCEKLLWNALLKYEATHLNGIIITHPHIDHDGSLPMLLNKSSLGAASIETLFYNGLSVPGADGAVTRSLDYIDSTKRNPEATTYTDAKTEESVTKAIYNELIPLQTGSTIDMGANTTLEVLWPTEEFREEMQWRIHNQSWMLHKGIGDKADDNGGSKGGHPIGVEGNGATYSINNSSIVARLYTKNNDFSMLLTGDAGRGVFIKSLGSMAKTDYSTLSSLYGASLKGDYKGYHTLKSQQGDQYKPPLLTKDGKPVVKDGKYYTLLTKVPYGSSSLENGGLLTYNEKIRNVKVFKACHHSQSAANLTSVITEKAKPEVYVISGGNYYNAYNYSDNAKWSTLIPRIATMQKLSAYATEDEDDEGTDETSGTEDARKIPFNSMFCTGLQGDINIGVFGKNYVVLPSNPDSAWPYNWTEFTNKRLLTTDSTWRKDHQNRVRQYEYGTFGITRNDSVNPAEVTML